MRAPSPEVVKRRDNTTKTVARVKSDSRGKRKGKISQYKSAGQTGHFDLIMANSENRTFGRRNAGGRPTPAGRYLNERARQLPTCVTPRQTTPTPMRSTVCWATSCDHEDRSGNTIDENSLVGKHG